MNRARIHHRSSGSSVGQVIVGVVGGVPGGRSRGSAEGADGALRWTVATERCCDRAGDGTKRAAGGVAGGSLGGPLGATRQIHLSWSGPPRRGVPGDPGRRNRSRSKEDPSSWREPNTALRPWPSSPRWRDIRARSRLRVRAMRSGSAGPAHDGATCRPPHPRRRRTERPDGRPRGRGGDEAVARCS